MQKLIISGNVGQNAVLRRTPANDAVLGFSLAVGNGKDKQGQERPATWYDCSVWGKRGEALDGHITKGTKLLLIGRPSAREHEGKVYMQISVDELEFMGGGQSNSAPRENQGGGTYGGFSGGYGAGGLPDGDGDFIPF